MAPCSIQVPAFSFERKDILRQYDPSYYNNFIVHKVIDYLKFKRVKLSIRMFTTIIGRIAFSETDDLI